MFNNSSFYFFWIEGAKYGISFAFRNTCSASNPIFWQKTWKQTSSQKEKRFKSVRKILILLQIACWINRGHRVLVGVLDG